MLSFFDGPSINLNKTRKLAFVKKTPLCCRTVVWLSSIENSKPHRVYLDTLASLSSSSSSSPFWFLKEYYKSLFRSWFMLVIICIFLSAYGCAELLSAPSSVSRGSSPEDSHGILYCDYCTPTHSNLVGGWDSRTLHRFPRDRLSDHLKHYRDLIRASAC